MLLFFFQAEDGIRDTSVTGVQTCALPIFGFRTSLSQGKFIVHPDVNDHLIYGGKAKKEAIALMKFCAKPVSVVGSRSEERRVGKEGRGRWDPGWYHTRGEGGTNASSRMGR